MADEASSELVLASAHNFRDVAGPGGGYPTADGRRMRVGVLYRSNELRLSDADVNALVTRGVTSIVDLRSPSALNTHPDRWIPGARWRHLGVQGLASRGLQGVVTREDALAVMLRTYTDFVHSAPSRASFGQLLRMLAYADDVTVFHCTAGKDRTGWASALLQTIAGVDHDVVVADYLLSNDRRVDPPEAYLLRIIPDLDAGRREVYEPALRVRQAYLEAGLAAAREQFGDLDAYLREGLGVGLDVQVALRRRLVL